MTYYQLPDGRIVEVHDDVCHDCLFITYQLESGEIVWAKRIESNWKNALKTLDIKH
jgi:hypothetical protein